MTNVLLGSVLAIAIPALFSPSEDCNDMNRNISSKAGGSGKVTTPCVQLTIGGTAGGEIQAGSPGTAGAGDNAGGTGEAKTPAECMVSYATTSQNIYRCKGALPDVNCDWDKYKATVTVFTGGKCPTWAIDWSSVSFSIMGTLNTVPKAVLSGLDCHAPVPDASQDPSAGLADCAAESNSGAGNYSIGSQVTGGSGELATVLSTALLPSPVSGGSFSPYNIFLSGYEVAQTGTPGELGGLLGDIALSEVGVLAGTMTATVEIQDWSTGATVADRSYRERVSGTLALAGQFDCDRQIDGTYLGQETKIDHRTTYDLYQLQDHAELGEIGNAWISGAGLSEAVRATHTDRIRVVYDWLRDPFTIPLFPGGVSFQETLLPNGNILAARHQPLTAGGTFVGEEYELFARNGSFIPIRRTLRSVGGEVISEYIYSNFLEFRPGDWRPAKIVLTHFLDMSPTGDRRVIELKVIRATAHSTSPLPAIPGPWDTGLIWMSWI